VSEVGSGWYLDRIEVMGPEGTQSSFPCHNWLGKSDAGDHRGARALRRPAALPAFMPCRRPAPASLEHTEALS